MTSQLSGGMGLVLVEFEYEYEGKDGALVSIKPNERYVLLAKTNNHWWQVRRDQQARPIYIPAKYVKELPPELPSPLGLSPPRAPAPLSLPRASEREEPAGARSKPGNEVTIRLRSERSSHRKKENRMSTFGVPLELHESLASDSPPAFKHVIVPPDAGTTVAHVTAHVTEGALARKRPSLAKALIGADDLSVKPRVPSFSPADPLVTPSRSQAHLIAVESPTVPALLPRIQIDTPPVPEPAHSVLEPQGKHGKEEGPMEEDEGLEEEVSVEELVEEEDITKEEDGNHIYESIQDLNLDLDSLIGPPLTKAPTEDVKTVGSDIPVYNNNTETKTSSVPELAEPAPSADSASIPAVPTLSLTGSPNSSLIRTPTSSVSSSGIISPASPLSPLDEWQAHTDKDSKKVFYYNSVTRQTTWSDPHSPPPPLPGEMDQSSPSANVSSASPQAKPLSLSSHYKMSPNPVQKSWNGWEQLVDQTSGKHYYYNPTSGATSWAAPQPQPQLTSVPGPESSPDQRPPPLPEEDYPLDNHSERHTHTAAAQEVKTVDDIGKARVYVHNGSKSLLNLPELSGASSSQPPQGTLGNGVEQDGLLMKGCRHSMAPPTTAPDNKSVSSHTRKLSDYSHAHHSHLQEKAGILNKTKVAENGRRIRKNWSQSWTVLHGGVLTFYKDPKTTSTGPSNKSNQIVPEFTLDLRGASLCRASKDKSSKKNVLELKTRQSCEFLVQYDTDSIIWDWNKVLLDTIKQLDHEHLSEDDDDKEKKRNLDSGVRTKLRRFLQGRPTLASVKEKGYIRDSVFGCHLDTLCHRENTTVPKFVEKCIRAVDRRGIDVDGIYRVSGNLAVIQKLRHKADHEDSLDLEDGQWEEIHVIAGALKMFFRELPEPLFPFSTFHKFITAIKVPDYNTRVSYMKDLVSSLPLPNHDTMKLLFTHLLRVIDRGESNRMSVQSVAIVFGPTLLRPQRESANLTEFMVFQNQIVELILNEFHEVFGQS